MVKSTAYPSLDSLFDLACRDGVDIRPTLLRVLTDLYVQKPVHSADEEIQYVELALGLVDTVDADTRAIVATRLAAYRGAPEAVLRRLETYASSGISDEIQPPSSSTVDPVELFFDATPEERRLILTSLDAVADPGTVRPMTAGDDMIFLLEGAALAQNADEFGRLLERALGVGPQLAGQIIHDSSGEPIIVAAKALGIKSAVLQRILLFLNPAIGRSIERVHRLADLYDEISSAAAAYMISLWRKGHAHRSPAHAPLYWNDQPRSARSFANPAPRPTPRDRDAPWQIKSGER